MGGDKFFYKKKGKNKVISSTSLEECTGGEFFIGQCDACTGSVCGRGLFAVYYEVFCE